MAEVFTIADAATNGLGPADKSLQLSDGTSILTYYDGTHVHLAFQPSHTSAPTDIDSAAETAFYNASATPGTWLLLRDPQDNLYLVGGGASTGKLAGVAYVKGAGHTWTKKTALTSSSAISFTGNWSMSGRYVPSNPDVLAVMVVGTSGTNYIIGYTLNAANLRAGSGALLITSDVESANTGTWGGSIDMASADGALSGVWATNSGNLGSWSVDATGHLSAPVPLWSVTNAGGPGAVRLIYNPNHNNFILIVRDNTNYHWWASLHSTTGLISGPYDSGSPTNMPLNFSAAWGAFLDPATLDQIWVLAPGSTTAGTTSMWRLLCAVSASSAGWAAAATAAENLVATGTAGGPTVLRVVKQPTIQQVDYQVQETVAGTASIVGAYEQFAQPPYAPTNLSPTGNPTIDRTSAETFSWTYNSADRTAASAHDLQWRQGTGAWTVINVPNGTPSYTFAANSLPSGQVEWQARSYNSIGEAGSWSASSFVTMGTPPSGMAITDPVNGGTIGSTPYPVTWTAPAQDSYQLRRVADLGDTTPDTSTVYYDTGEVVGTARTASVPFETNGRWEHLQLRVKSAGLWSVWVDAREDVSYTTPPVPTATLTPDSNAGTITVTITNPPPGTGQPAVSHNDVWRRIGATGEPLRIATNVPVNGATVDATPASAVDYQYQIVANGTNTTSIASAWID